MHEVYHYRQNILFELSRLPQENMFAWSLPKGKCRDHRSFGWLRLWVVYAKYDNSPCLRSRYSNFLQPLNLGVLKPHQFQMCHLQRNIRPLASPVASSGSRKLTAVTSDECKSGILPRYWYRPPASAPQVAPALLERAKPFPGSGVVSWANGRRHKKASVLRVRHAGGKDSSGVFTTVV